MDLEQEFAARGPWQTRFVIGGKEYGGWFLPDGDKEREFFKLFPAAVGGRVLELGSCEGGRTVHLAARAKSVCCLEGRQASIDRAQFAVVDAAGFKNVEFHREDLENLTLPPEEELEAAGAHGRFDAAFVVGVLYHLLNPWHLIEKLAKVTDSLYVWTHYCQPDKVNQKRRGVPGYEFREDDSIFASLRGLSFWPTLEGLLTLLEEHFTAKVLRTEAHEHGPAVTLTAVRRKKVKDDKADKRDRDVHGAVPARRG